MTSCCYHLNALFDLELGGFPTARVARFSAELSVLFLPCCSAGDSIVLDVGIDDSYLSYLAGNGLFFPENVTVLSGHESASFSGKAVCWGWNAKAAAGKSPIVRHCYPSPDVVARVNSRRFCSMAGEKSGAGVPGSRLITNSAEFDRLTATSGIKVPFVVKPLFGSSGYGLRVCEHETDLESCRRTVADYCHDGGCVVEPWCGRLFDIGSVALIPRGGGATEVLLHRQQVNRFGAFYGVYIEDDDPQLATWNDTIVNVTRRYSESAAAEGYFGPLGVDSFVYQTNGGTTALAAGIEINGRWTMGLLAHRIRRKIGGRGCLKLHFFGQRRCRLPETYEELGQILGDRMFNPATSEGVILLTPLRAFYEKIRRQPQQSVFLIAASSIGKIEEYDSFLTGAFRPSN